jgi:hypothetical protein
MNGQASFETARDTIRAELLSQSPAQFHCRTRGTSFSASASTNFAPQNLVAISSPECTNCGLGQRPPKGNKLHATQMLN